MRNVRIPGKINHYYIISAALQMNYTHRASIADKQTSLCGPGLPQPMSFHSEEQVHSPLKAIKVTMKSQLS